MKAFFSSSLTMVIISLLLINNSSVAQRLGYTLEFDGVNDYVSIPDDNLLDLDASSYTLEAWIYADNLNSDVIGRGVISKWAEDGDSYFVRVEPEGDIHFDMMHTEDGLITPQKWHHIACVYDHASGDRKVYVDGVEKSLTGTPLVVVNNDEPLKIGFHHTASLPWEGKIDEVRVWNVARTQAQITANMYSEISPEATLQAYYRVNGVLNIDLQDDSGNNHHGAFNGNPTWKVSGSFAGSRNALSFDGINDYVLIGNNPSLRLTNELTLEAWVNIESTSSGMLVAGKLIHGGANEGYALAVNTTNLGGAPGKVTFIAGRNWGDWWNVTSQKTLNVNEWYHISATFDGRYLKVYINGVLDNTTDIGSTKQIVDSGTNFSIGSWQAENSHYFKGKIDEVRVWNTVRLDYQIQQEMTCNLTGRETGLAAYYRMDQLDGNTLYDVTSNANNGTLTNMDIPAAWVDSEAFNFWLGSESSSWNDPKNWSSGKVPTTVDNVGIYKDGIASNVEVTSPINVNSLMVSLASDPLFLSSINVNKGILLLVENVVMNGANNKMAELNISDNTQFSLSSSSKLEVDKINNKGALILSADKNSAAQILNAETISDPGLIIVRRVFYDEDGWQFVSLPFEVPSSNIKLAGTKTTATWGDGQAAGYDFNVAQYDGQKRDMESSYAVENSSNWAPVAARTLLANKGYIIAVGSDVTLDFICESGLTTMFNHSQIKNLDKYEMNDSVVHRSWNLIGNPFASAYNLGFATNEHSPLYYYDGNTYQVLDMFSSFKAYPFTSFFVQALGVESYLSFSQNGKSLKAPIFRNFQELNLAVKNNLYTDKTIVRFDEESTKGFDPRKDGVKFMSLKTSVPQIYTKTNNLHYALNYLPENTKEVDLLVKTSGADTYQISLEDKASLPFEKVLLIDGQNQIDLKTQDYSFTTSTASTKAMKVKIVDVSVDIHEIEKDGVEIKVEKNYLIVSHLASLSDIVLYNVSGQIIKRFSRVNNGDVLPVSYQGVVVVGITNEKQQITQKIVL